MQKPMYLLFMLACTAVSNLLAQNTTLKLPTIAGTPGEVTLPISVTNFDNVNAISLTIEYEEQVLTFVEIQNSAPGIAFIANAQDGELRLAWAGFSPVSIADEGGLVELVFDYVDDSSAVTFNVQQSELNDPDGAPIAVAYENGFVSPLSQTTLLHLPMLSEPAGTAVAFPITVENFNDVQAVSLVIDYDPTVLEFVEPANQAPGTMFIANADNGSLRMAWAGFAPVSIADGDTLVELLFNYSDGVSTLDFDTQESEISDVNGQALAAIFENGSIEPFVVPTTLYLPDTTAVAGGSISLPMTVANFIDVNAISLALIYPEAVLSFSGIANPAPGISFVDNANDGVLRLAWAGFSPVSIADDGTLVDLQFTYLQGEGAVAFDADQSELNDADGNRIPLELIDGHVSLRLEPDIAITPLVHDFGDVIEGNTASMVFVVSNEGNAELQVATPTIMGAQADQFAVRDPEAFNLAPDETRDLVVDFTPTSLGAKSGTLLVTSNDPDENSLQVSLNGTAVPVPIPDISVQPSSYNYGDVTVGNAIDKKFVVSNAGTAPLQLDAPELSGVSADQFHFEGGSAAVVLAIGESDTLVVVFSPTSVGTKTATLRFVSNDPDENPLEVALSGNGVAVPVPDISVEPETHNYGETIIDSTRTQVFVVSNDGTALLDLEAPVISGSQDFVITSGSAAVSLEPGASHDLTVVFKPMTTGEKQATLLLANNDPDENPLEVSLSGIGIPLPAPDIMVEPVTLDFGNVPLDSSAMQPVTVSNVGNADLQLDSLVWDGDVDEFSVNAGVLPTTLAPQASDELQVWFAPTAPGGWSTTLFLYHNDTDDNPVQVTVSGTGFERPTSVDEAAAAPKTFALKQNYPNPFNPETVIPFELPASTHVRLSVFNVLGQVVTVLVDDVQLAGGHTVIWLGNDELGRPVPSGVYLYQLKSDNFVSTRKFILLR